MKVGTRGHGRAQAKRMIAVILCVLATACGAPTVKLRQAPAVAPSASQPWTPSVPAGPVIVHGMQPMEIPKELAEGQRPWTLVDAVDVALRNSGDTRAAWAAARVAAADYGAERGAYFPRLDLNANRVQAQGGAVGGLFTFRSSSIVGSADLSMLLFDFGGREARVDQMRQALVAADFQHNAAIQQVILEVERAFAQYVAAQALLESERAALEEARKSLEAAETRHTAGVATIADVLQAKTALAEARLRLLSTEGAIDTTGGALATLLGLPIDTPFKVDPGGWEFVVPQVTGAVTEYLEEARLRRPDLEAARASVLEADARARSVKSGGLPSISAAGGVGRTYYDGFSTFVNTYNFGFFLTVPLFTGFSHEYDVVKARAQADEERARLLSLEQRALLEAWTSYTNVKTAAARFETTETLLQSATESHQVALGRYKAGVGSILDLLAAQASLEAARARRVQARTDWFISMAELAQATGSLSLDTVPRTPPNPGKEVSQ